MKMIMKRHGDADCRRYNGDDGDSVLFYTPVIGEQPAEIEVTIVPVKNARERKLELLRNALLAAAQGRNTYPSNLLDALEQIA